MPLRFSQLGSGSALCFAQEPKYSFDQGLGIGVRIEGADIFG